MIKQLSKQLRPKNYKLSLEINSKKTEFTGKVIITGDTLKEKSNIQLHAKDLKIESAVINGESAKHSFDEHDVLNLEQEHEIKLGAVKIEIKFSGKITDAMHGVYPCYFKHEGKQKKLIATQFESHHAREVFPCVDEPAGKATFDLTLITDEGEVVLGNTPAKSSKNKDGRLETVFETTPKMSTYLLAFVTGEMHYLEAETKNGVTVRSWATVAQKKKDLQFSVSDAVNYIDFFDEYFGVPYPLEKCDQVALPDFESGAMENWGLITYRETVMLHDESNPSLSTKQLIAIVTAHELSHQWFGNLVTMQWWDDLWLNESFASMMEYIAVDAVHPEWKIWEDFVGADCISATNRDVYTDVQPVRVDVPNPETIHTLFDPSIVYAKGGKLLKTLHDLLGQEKWRAGLKKYFKQHAYRNTTMDDLWSALSDVSKHDVGKIMHGWITSPGQPLLEVDQKHNKAEISQRRLLLDQSDPKSSWIIPLIANQEIDLLEKQSDEYELENENWLLLNTSGTGHFVVDYKNPEHKLWVEKQITTNNGSNTWKITHLNELVMLAKNGTTALTEALDTIKLCANEERAAVWSQISAIIGNAKMLTEGDDAAENALHSFTYNLVQPTYTKLGWEYEDSEESNTTHLRTTAISLAVGSENPEVISDALEAFHSVKDVENLPAELRALLMGAAVKHGEEHVFGDLIDIYKATNSADLKNDICLAISSSKNKPQLKSVLELMTDTKVIRTQDTIRWYAYIMRNKYGRELAWEWLKTNWEWIVQTFGGSKSFDDFARYSAAFMNSEEWLKEYKGFFGPKLDDTALKRTIQIGLKEVEARVKWRQRDETKIKAWLIEYSA